MDSSALKNEFLIESFENLSSINEDLTQLEKDPENKDLLNKLYRTVHTMKGSASFLGYKKLQEITHSAENLLDELREEKFLINTDITDTLLETFDICHLILKAIEEQDNEGEVAIEQTKQLLEKLLESQGEVNPSSKPEPEVSSTTQKDVESEDSELSELIFEHRGNSLPETDSAAATEDSSEEDELSAAALESLKELVGDGKMDASVLNELSPDVKAESAMKVEDDHAQQEVKESEDKVDDQVSGETQTQALPKSAETKPTETPKVNPVIDDNRKSIADSFVRVNVKVLDKIMNIVGELVLNRNQIVQYSNSHSAQELSKLSQQLNIITSELQSEVMSTRMQPIGSILTKFERLVRDFSRENNKKISLKLTGQDTELDKTLIEAIKDPLVHIIRNACDHGLETIEERAQVGKKDEGMIHIKSYNESGQVTVEIVDNGRGLNRDKIAAKAVEKGVISADRVEKMSDSQIFSLIFAPGFSTAEKITNISGRGVGMDVVKTNIEKIGGSVSVSSELGVGTTFKLRIPLTLAIVPALIIKSHQVSFAIPQLNLVELVRLENSEGESALEKIQGSEFLKLRGNLTPVFRLNDLLKLKEVFDKAKSLEEISKDILEEGTTEHLNLEKYNHDDSVLNIAILNAEDRIFGVIVDEILDTEEIVVKPLSNSLKQLSLFGGATIMGDGKVALILDALGFINTVSSSSEAKSAKEEIAVDSLDISGVDHTELQENLLFKLYDGREYAVPLSLVSRLEEISVDSIQMTGNQPIVRYLNAPMPLISLEKTLGLMPDSIITKSKEMGITDLSCIVMTVQGKNYGVIVKEVLDISIDNVSIDDSAVDREGILGTVFIHDNTISLIDIYAVIEAQNLGGMSAKLKKTREKNQSLAKAKKILVVEDSPMYRKMEVDLLEGIGYEVDVAHHGEEGIEKLKNNNYDLVITDIEMPHLNGFDFAKKVRQELQKDDLTIIALSTRFSEEDKKKGIESGFSYHLEKLKKHEVADLVMNLLNN